MKARPRILLDCDPGIDDAFAIMVALRFSELVAVTTVAGNVSVDKTTRNALWVLELANASHVPVHQGAASPLNASAVWAEEIHGVSGLGTLDVPEPKTPASEVSAQDAILQHCSAGDAIIVAVGPLTNIALALQADPSLAGRIGHLHWMGGSAQGGNTTPYAEFNAHFDPEAVAVVLASGCPFSMYGLDLTYQVRLNDADIDSLREANTQTGTHLGDFLSYYRSTASPGEVGQPIHDACAVLGTTHPDLFERAPSRIVCETVAADKRGQTTVLEVQESHHTHVSTVDAQSARELIISSATNPEPQS